MLRMLAWPALVLLLCGVGLAFRLNHLGDQSLWLDEGAAYHYASLPPGDLLRSTFREEPNPPLYYLALHGWMLLAGENEAALRLLSVITGVVGIALLAFLGRDLASPAAGLGAAAIASVSPYLIWYAQEARMYSLLACLATGTLWMCWRAARRSLARDWLGFGILLAATLYTHFFGVFVFAACGLFLLTRRKVWRSAAVALAGPALLYVPWLVAVLRAGATRGSWREPLTIAEMASRTATAFVHGGFLPESVGAPLVVGATAAAVVGLVAIAWRGQGRWPGAILLLGALLLPAVGIAVLTPRMSIFGERYLIAQAPLFYLAIAAGLTLPLRRFAPLAAPICLAFAAVALVANTTAWHDPRFRKEDFRAVAAYLEAHAAPGDTILLVADYVTMPFAYYYRGPGDVVPFIGDVQHAESLLEAHTTDTRVLWLLLSHAEQADPDDSILRWLQERYPIATEQFPRGIRLYGFRTTYRETALPPEARPTSVRFGDALELVGYQTESGLPPTDDRLHPPSNWVHVTLYWRLVRPVGENYQSQVRVINERGVWGEKLDRANGTLGMHPTSSWQVGEIVVEEVDVNLNPAMPPSDYALEVQALAGDGQPLPVTHGSPTIGSVTIVAPAPPAPGWQFERTIDDLGQQLAAALRLDGDAAVAGGS